MSKKTFVIQCKMEERWIDDFCSMLKYMEFCGNAGHSAAVGFYSDGDGDFRPEFKILEDYNKKHGYFAKKGKELPDLEVIFDAG